MSPVTCNNRCQRSRRDRRDTGHTRNTQPYLLDRTPSPEPRLPPAAVRPENPTPISQRGSGSRDARGSLRHDSAAHVHDRSRNPCSALPAGSQPTDPASGRRIPALSPRSAASWASSQALGSRPRLQSGPASQVQAQPSRCSSAPPLAWLLHQFPLLL